MREKIFSAIGNKILYEGIETCDYTLNGKSPRIAEFKKIPSEIIENEEVDFSIFAIILDARHEKNDFFNCIILIQDKKPQYIIYCNQEVPKSHECNLKIKYMIVGNYTDFNSIDYDTNIRLEVIKKNYNSNQPKLNKSLLGFKANPSDHFIGIPVLNDLWDLNHLKQENSIIGHHFYTDQDDNVGIFTFPYSLNNNKYISLSNFSFHILKISNVPIKTFDKKTSYGEICHPKYFSLYSKDSNNFCPIFFKYTIKEIKLKLVISKCKCQSCILYKNSSKFKDKLNLLYFDLPKNDFT